MRPSVINCQNLRALKASKHTTESEPKMPKKCRKNAILKILVGFEQILGTMSGNFCVLAGNRHISHQSRHFHERHSNWATAILHNTVLIQNRQS